MILRFDVQNQTLSRTESARTVEGSRNYLQCAFSFSEDWNGLSKAVLFKSIDMEKPVAVLLGADNVCNIPNGAAAQHLSIAVIGGGTNLISSLTGAPEAEDETKIITTNTLSIQFEDTLDTDCMADLNSPENDFTLFLKEAASLRDALSAEVSARAAEAARDVLDAKADTAKVTELEDKHDSELQALSAELADNTAALEDVQGTLKNKVDKVNGKDLSTYDFNYTYKSKLDGIDKGAQKNTVTSVAGKTGAVTLEKADVGLDNVDNTSDMDKPVSTATQQAIENVQVTLNFLRSETARKFTEVFYIVERGDDTLPLSDHTDIRINVALTTLTLTMPSNYSNITDYECYLTFITGDTPTVLTYPDTAIKWVGVDCDSDGGFIPTANKTYEIGIKNIGVPGEPIIIARVGVC